MSEEKNFESLALRSELIEGLAALEYREMTVIQQASLPPILEGRDVVGRAKTGSGKTAAFALGALNSLDTTNLETQTLVLCPTRELADQVTDEIRRLAKRIANVRVLALCGGMPNRPQVKSLERGVHIVVGTPGRVLKHLLTGALELRALEMVVLDEADRMMDMGFSDEIDAILDHLPQQRQTLLFSATYPSGIADISEQVQDDPVHIDVTEADTSPEIEEYWSSVYHDERLDCLLDAMEDCAGTLNLVFCNTKSDVKQVTRYLQDENIAALSMHGDLEQFERTERLIRFSNQSATVLVATDVAARGLDIGQVDVVFNYELPPKPEVYLHRIGRTGRAGRKGRAYSLVTDRELRRLDAIQDAYAHTTIEEYQLRSVDEPASELTPSMTTIEVSGGRRNKLRPGDLVGALTSTKEIPGDAIGKIDVLEKKSFIAIQAEHRKNAVAILNKAPIKKKSYRARAIK
ncbi:MAG: ATP-dependent RNA helicase DbpA [Myxococcota bacterium]|nr:ATP-dependent RNA helicase DbpA [Myxococcota bacterium]